MVILICLLALKFFSWATSCGERDSSNCIFAGCEWVETPGTSCFGPADCLGKTSGTACEAVKGCKWYRASAGYCEISNDSACFESATCDNGCKQYPASGLCKSPSLADCLKLSSQSSCETGDNGCKWEAGYDSCEYQKPNCGILDKMTCSATSGCRYQPQSSECKRPQPEACEGFSTSDACGSSKRGCKWFEAVGSCTAPQCSDIRDETECAKTEGCEYRALEANCSAPRPKQCDEKTPSECDAEGSGCEWIPSSHECRDPPYLDCYGLDKATCRTENGCIWNVHNREYYCGLDRECSILSGTECTNSLGCEFFPERGQCTSPDSATCQCLSTEETCETESSGCKWNSGIAKCEPNSNLKCVENDDSTNCNTTSQDIGCVWKVLNNTRCQTDFKFNECKANEDDTACSNESQTAGCEWLDGDGHCQTNTQLECSENTGNTECQAVGCRWTFIPGNCVTNQDEGAKKLAADEINCTLKDDKSACTDDSNSECIYERYDAGCYKNNLSCHDDPCNVCSASSLDSGCLWKVTPAHCGVSNELNCVRNNPGTECNITSSPYCQWMIVQRMVCDVSYSSGVCYDNAAKDGCDYVISDPDPVCKWVSYPGRCYPDGKDECYDNEEGTACTPESKAAGCRWFDSPGGCWEDEDLYCVNNSAGNGCNTEASDAGCVWHSATTDSCRQDDHLLCVVNEAGTACSPYSTLIGCEWKSGLVGSCKEKGSGDKNRNSGSSIISVSLLGILVLFVFLL